MVVKLTAFKGPAKKKWAGPPTPIRIPPIKSIAGASTKLVAAKKKLAAARSARKVASGKMVRHRRP